MIDVGTKYKRRGRNKKLIVVPTMLDTHTNQVWFTARIGIGLCKFRVHDNVYKMNADVFEKAFKKVLAKLPKT